jgi:hypothetical protein
MGEDSLSLQSSLDSNGERYATILVYGAPREPDDALGDYEALVEKIEDALGVDCQGWIDSARWLRENLPAVMTTDAQWDRWRSLCRRLAKVDPPSERYIEEYSEFFVDAP